MEIEQDQKEKAPKADAVWDRPRETTRAPATAHLVAAQDKATVAVGEPVAVADAEDNSRNALTSNHSTGEKLCRQEIEQVQQEWDR